MCVQPGRSGREDVLGAREFVHPPITDSALQADLLELATIMHVNTSAQEWCDLGSFYADSPR